jgi:ribosomal protein S20
VSPIVITLLIVSGLVILISIGYINHMLENSKLEKARLRADLNDRVRRSRDVSDNLPAQLMTPALKLLLSRFELQFSDRLLPLDNTNSALRTRITELRELVNRNEHIPINNIAQQINSEAKAKEVRFTLENLNSQISRATQDGLMQANEARHWNKEIQNMLTLLHIDFFNTLGQQALQNAQPGQARLAFERGVQYLRKQPEPGKYQTQLAQLENQLNRANTLVLENSKPAADETNQLTEGLKSLEDEDDWKKKSF